MIKKTDYILLELIAKKNRKAFASLYNRYIKLIYKFVYQALNDQERTDDLIQEFWLKVWEDPSFLKCNQRESVQSYMLKNIRFRILDIYRETWKNMLSIDQIEESLQISYSTMTEGMNESDLFHAIREALDTQPHLVRKVFWLRIHDWSVEEAANALSVSKKTVYNNYSQSLSIVRKHLKNNYPDLVEGFHSTAKRKRVFSPTAFFFFL